LTRAERLFLPLANGLVGGSGLVYAAMRYLMTPSDEWSVVNHPWQPHVQHLHVLAAPLLLFAAGLIWSRHVSAKYRNGGQGRSTGIGLVVSLVPMAASGYLIQVAVDANWRTVWIVVHVASSLVWLAVLAAHQAKTWLVRGRASSRDGEPELDEPGVR
jgi:hypothetical protein